MYIICIYIGTYYIRVSYTLILYHFHFIIKPDANERRTKADVKAFQCTSSKSFQERVQKKFINQNRTQYKEIHEPQ